MKMIYLNVMHVRVGEDYTICIPMTGAKRVISIGLSVNSKGLNMSLGKIKSICISIKSKIIRSVL
jgi:hypothetical protein